MIIAPKEKPVLQNLNSHYLDIKKLLEHFQGELGSGAIHFKSASSEGIVFFDKDEFLNVLYQNKETMHTGDEAFNKLINNASSENFQVNIYEIDPQNVFFWANLPRAENIYSNLTSEFTNLQGLINKLSSERLTGYIDVSIKDSNEGGYLFFNNGEIVGGSYTWSSGGLESLQEDQALLTNKIKESGGVFNVYRIQLKESAPKTNNNYQNKNKQRASKRIAMLEEMLAVLEWIVNSDKKIKQDFSTLLKRKFSERCGEYDFLDPILAEFEYNEGKIRYSGDASDEELALGVLTCTQELADQLGIYPRFKTELQSWLEKYNQVLTRMGIEF